MIFTRRSALQPASAKTPMGGTACVRYVDGEDGCEGDGES